MKRNLLLSVAVYSLLAVAAAQTDGIDFTYSGREAVRSLENNLSYSLSPLRAGLLQISGMNSLEQRLNFSQQSRHSYLNLDLKLDSALFSHILSSGYEYLYDSSKLEESWQPYRNKTGFLGYAIGFQPSDSLVFEAGIKGYIRQEEDRYVLGHILASEGYQISGKASWDESFGNLNGGLSGDLDLKNLDWEHYQSAALNAKLDHSGERLSVLNHLSLSQRNDDLYVLAQSVREDGRGYYQFYDRQQRRSLSYTGSAEYAPNDKLQLRLQENYSHRTISLDRNIVRNNADYTNQASLQLDLALAGNLDWDASLNHNYSIKAFNYTENTRHTENRNISSGLDWEYAFGDTLQVGFAIDLQRASFPDDLHRWDNDNRYIRCFLNNTHYWKNRVKLSNRLAWTRSDDVYLSGILSDNNKRTNSLTYNPSCAVVIGDRLLFNQSYLIRADYTDYMYDSENKAFYRQLELTYDLLFDSFPFLARSSDQRWMLLPFRTKPENALLAKLSFGFERNEYADFVDDHYSVIYKNTLYAMTFTLKQDIGDLYYKIQPNYQWGTWREYNLLLGCAWNFTSNSLLEISLNPVGESLRDLDWRSSVSLSAHF